MNGIFATAFAKKKRWKLDEGLCRAIELFLADDDRPVIDIGAGVGEYVQWIQRQGSQAIGVDGIPDVFDLSGGVVREVDLTSAIAVNRFLEHFGLRPLGMCIEVAEHIPEELMASFLQAVSRLCEDRLLFSAAVIGQKGRHHISCHMPEWFAMQLSECDWELDEELTLQCRAAAGKGWDRKLMVFER